MKQRDGFLTLVLHILTVAAILLVFPASAYATPATQQADAGPADGSVYVSPETTDPLLREYQAALSTHIQDAAATNRSPRGPAGDSHGIVSAIVTVGQDGRIENVHIAQAASSILARHTEKLIYGIRPLDPFSPDLRARARRLVFVTHINYGE